MRPADNLAAASSAARCIHELFADRAAATPDAVAVESTDARITYGELERRANQLAHHLRDLGVGPDAVVGVHLERSPELLVSLLGVLKSGGAYLPLDPDYPAERLRFMLQDARTAVLISDRARGVGLTDVPARLVRIDADWDEIARRPEHAPASGDALHARP